MASQWRYVSVSRDVQRHLLRMLAVRSQATATRLYAELARYRIARPVRHYQSMQYILSALVRKSNISLAFLVRLVRGETVADPRPNKALDPRTYQRLLVGYEHKELMMRIANEGFRAAWLEPAPSSQANRANHRSATIHEAQVAARILEGERAGTYLVLDADLLDQWAVQVSPFGAVPKTDSGASADIRLIHDLSYPRGACVNDQTVQCSLPQVRYDSVRALARRIEQLHCTNPGVRVLLLKGDVKSAFRHLRQHADDVHWMGGRVPLLRAGVIDLSAPFGWTGSPAFYSVFGRAISTLVGRESPSSMSPAETDTTPFFAYEWVDDHVLVEPEVGNRCVIAEDVLRLAMMAILGPLAINEEKFTVWATRARVLGLDWDSEERTVSMPPDKIRKALTRVNTALSTTTIATITLQRLLGSLRHVATCVRAARPFYQRLHAICSQAPRHGSMRLSAWAIDDLRWFNSILRSGALRGVPTSLFGSLPQAEVHLYMDASGDGLCVLDPSAKRYIVLNFDAVERTNPKFDINVREQFAVTLACLIFGQSWHEAFAPHWPHIRCWSDNQTTVSRTNTLSARHTLAQELNRCIGLAEATWRLRISSSHLPGACNQADDGSWRSDPAHRRRFANTVASWTQLQAASLAPSSRRLYERTWRQWREWRRQQNASCELSRHPEEQSLQLALFAVSCWLGSTTNITNSPATVLSKCSHVSWYHQVMFGFTVNLTSSHRLALLGMRRMSPPPRRRAPVTVAHMHQLRSTLNFQQIRDRVLWGAAVLGFFFLLRRSEYLGVDGSAAWFVIQRRDVSLTDNQGRIANDKSKMTRVTITFRGSKTDQVGETTTRTLPKSQTSWLCPVRAARALLKENHDKPMDTPLCSVDGAVLPTRAIDEGCDSAYRNEQRFGMQFGEKWHSVTERQPKGRGYIRFHATVQVSFLFQRSCRESIT